MSKFNKKKMFEYIPPKYRVGYFGELILNYVTLQLIRTVYNILENHINCPHFIDTHEFLLTATIDCFHG